MGNMDTENWNIIIKSQIFLKIYIKVYLIGIVVGIILVEIHKFKSNGLSKMG